MTTRMRVGVDFGKYTVVMEDDGSLYALRYGEKWRDLTGDKLVAALAIELAEAREKLATVRGVVKE